MITTAFRPPLQSRMLPPIDFNLDQNKTTRLRKTKTRIWHADLLQNLEVDQALKLVKFYEGAACETSTPRHRLAQQLTLLL